MRRSEILSARPLVIAILGVVFDACRAVGVVHSTLSVIGARIGTVVRAIDSEQGRRRLHDKVELIAENRSLEEASRKFEAEYGAAMAALRGARVGTDEFNEDPVSFGPVVVPSPVTEVPRREDVHPIPITPVPVRPADRADLTSDDDDEDKLTPIMGSPIPSPPLMRRSRKDAPANGTMLAAPLAIAGEITNLEQAGMGASDVATTSTSAGGETKQGRVGAGEIEVPEEAAEIDVPEEAETLHDDVRGVEASAAGVTEGESAGEIEMKAVDAGASEAVSEAEGEEVDKEVEVTPRGKKRKASCRDGNAQRRRVVGIGPNAIPRTSAPTPEPTREPNSESGVAERTRRKSKSKKRKSE